MGKSTADAATAKLFGAPPRASKASPPSDPETPTPGAAKAARASPGGTPRGEAERPVPAAQGKATAPPAPSKRGAPAAPTRSAGAAAEPSRRASAAEASPNTGNYLGQSLYLYKGVAARKLSVYVEPSVAAGLRMAAASGADPRGSDMSEIVDTLLRENGYADWRPPTT